MYNSVQRLSACNLDYLGRQLKFWKRYGVSDSYAIKLLKVWIGYETRDLMDELGRYPAQNFNELRRRLGFSSCTKLLNSVRQSRSLYAVGFENGTITHIYSPVWHQYEESDGYLIFSGIESQDCDHIFDGNITDNIYNNTTVGNAEAFSPGGEGGGEARKEQLAVNDDKFVRQALVRDYFKWMENSADADHKILLADIKYRICNPRDKKGQLIPDMKLTAAQGDEVWQVMVERVLANVLAGNENFFLEKYMTHPEKRIFWMRNLMKKFGFGFIKDARRIWQKQHVEIEAETAKKIQESQMKYRPISEFEWMDSEGVRWFENDLGKTQNIPDDAPPRPSATATYISIKKEWREKN